MKKRAGFTLIELLIVMAIIAALMAVLIPTAAGAMRKARATRIAVQLRNLEQGIEQYLMATLPPATEINFVSDSSKLTDGGFVDAQILSDTNLRTAEAIPDTANNQIVIAVEYDTGNGTLADLVKGTLVQTYGDGGNTYPPAFDASTSEGVYVDGNGKVAVVKKIEAFWW
ncbi:prepilin-type N-terminal cleavage/methylation domain-containing protein [Thermotoga sp. KOL6]|uniref:prepilin-type N-terminal cleavage/methylation domain-containing protein n=1 Tax=Thermotoga sp. KOL6 TaxID=126741 RepID=UPI000C756AAD|nr:prepilin-type N-terminal cleavage/methylation domain-containing protein [Thermotoga sp. KOL6]PLV59984.1 hypothetical protein AS005_01435 [Thermotoga sp. KOL6]